MQQLLKPPRFEASSSNTSNEWSFWRRCFENFVSVLPADDNTDANKLLLLTSHLSPSVYKLISGCTTYESALQKLENTYIKQKNVIFARFQLSTRSQQITESIDDFLLSLEELSKDCGFKAVTAEVYRDESIRNAFITGLASDTIRERLLENSTLSLEQAVDQARALESAHRNANLYNSSSLTPLNAISEHKSSDATLTSQSNEIYAASFVKNKNTNNQHNCFFWWCYSSTFKMSCQ